MAEPDNSPASAEERQKRIKENTSVGKFALIQLKEFFVPIISLVVGGAAGLGLGRNKTVAKFVEEKVSPKVSKIVARISKRFGSAIDLEAGHAKDIHVPADGILITGGVLTGGIASGMALNYPHWRDTQSEKLAVGEINQDIVNLVKERSKFADTLNRQEKTINDLLVQRQQSGETHVDRATAPSATTDVLGK